MTNVLFHYFLPPLLHFAKDALLPFMILMFPSLVHISTSVSRPNSALCLDTKMQEFQFQANWVSLLQLNCWQADGLLIEIDRKRLIATASCQPQASVHPFNKVSLSRRTWSIRHIGPFGWNGTFFVKFQGMSNKNFNLVVNIKIFWPGWQS